MSPSTWRVWNRSRPGEVETSKDRKNEILDTKEDKLLPSLGEDQQKKLKRSSHYLIVVEQCRKVITEGKDKTKTLGRQR